MKKEADVYQALTKMFPGNLDRMECIPKGIPDINYCLTNKVSGWIELKFVEFWPVKGDTKTNFGLSAPQSLFLSKRAKIGYAFLLVWIENEYFLFDGKDAFTIEITKITRGQAEVMSIIHFPDKDDNLRFILPHLGYI